MINYQDSNHTVILSRLADLYRYPSHIFLKHLYHNLLGTNAYYLVKLVIQRLSINYLVIIYIEKKLRYCIIFKNQHYLPCKLYSFKSEVYALE